jgi:ADP-ribose pyrophosphatase YjhB (NUDIX family)
LDLRAARPLRGYQHTFPEGRVETGLTYQQNAHEEVFEETGLLGDITGLIGDFVGDTTMTRYYVGIRTGGEPTGGSETQAVKLVTIDDAEPLLNKSKDKDVLKAVAAVALPVGVKVPEGENTKRKRD